MSAINLPVKAYRHNYEIWRIRDAESRRISNDLTELKAKEIARVLNMHEELVKTLTSIRDMTNADDEKSYRANDREGCLDTVFATARQCVAHAEANESK